MGAPCCTHQPHEALSTIAAAWLRVVATVLQGLEVRLRVRQAGPSLAALPLCLKERKVGSVSVYLFRLTNQVTLTLTLTASLGPQVTLTLTLTASLGPQALTLTA